MVVIMLTFEIEKLRETLEKYDATDKLDLLVTKANELNDLIYSTGYAGVIENPIITYVNNYAKYCVIALEHFKLTREIKDLAKKKEENPEDQTIDEKISHAQASLDLAMEGLTKYKGNMEKSKEYINSTIAEQPDKKEQATEKFAEIETLCSQIGHEFNKKPNPEKMTHEELLIAYKNLLEENKELKLQNDSINARLEALEAKQKVIDEKKNQSILSKLKNGFKKVKKKVVAAKDFVVGFVKDKAVPFIKNHKKATIAILATIALAGVVGSCVVYGTPLAIPARIISAMWHPFKLVGLEGPLHSINEFLIGKLGNGTFDLIKGTWTIGSKTVNNMNIFEMVLGNLPAAAILAGTGYGLFKGGKRLIKWSKKRVKDHKKEEPESLPPAYNFENFSDEELENKISELEAILDSGEITPEYKDFTLDQIEEMFNVAAGEQEYRQNLNNPNNNEDNFESLNKRSCKKAMRKLNKLIKKWTDKTKPQEININGEYFKINNVDEARQLYDEISYIYELKFGGRTR